MVIISNHISELKYDLRVLARAAPRIGRCGSIQYKHQNLKKVEVHDPQLLWWGGGYSLC